MNPRRITLTSSNKFAYVANLDDASISQYKLNADGTLSANNPPTVALPLGAGPVMVAVNRHGTFAWVVDDDLSAIYQFRINPDGTLTPNASPSIAVAFPSFMTVDRGGRFAYIDDSGSLLYQFKIRADGTLKPNPNASNSVPAGSNNDDILLLR